MQIASSGDALILLTKEFPTLKFHRLVSYKASYAIRITFMLNILFQLPKFLMAIRKEHQAIEKIVESENIDFIISDNRYGCWSKNVPCVLITHQINILMSPSWKWMEGLINFGNHRQIKKFTECWVPDFPNGITGRMTEPRNLKIRFIGMISRFKKMNIKNRLDVLAVISGPEPQRSVFEIKVREQLEKSGLRYFIVKGKPGFDNDRLKKNNEENYMTSNALNEMIEASELIISRSGYTTVMDLCKLGKKAIFIPTPGQTEQEYLAEGLKAKGIAFYQSQNQFDLPLALEESKKYKGFEGYSHSSNLLAEAVDSILNYKYPHVNT